MAKESDVEGWREKMFNGEQINRTEERAVLHTALRNRSSKSPILCLMVKISILMCNYALNKMKAFSEKVRQGLMERLLRKTHYRRGKYWCWWLKILGPQMVTEALKQYSDNSVNVHYVSNVDGTQIANVLSAR